jgi:hypothetical protein
MRSTPGYKCLKGRENDNLKNLNVDMDKKSKTTAKDKGIISFPIFPPGGAAHWQQPLLLHLYSPGGSGCSL